jgi:hypothetical protein
MAVVAMMPMANEATAVAVKPGVLARFRTANLISRANCSKLVRIIVSRISITLDECGGEIDGSVAGQSKACRSWSKGAVDDWPGEQVYFEAINRMGSGSAGMTMVFGAGPLYLTLKRMC